VVGQQGSFGDVPGLGQEGAAGLSLRRSNRAIVKAYFERGLVEMGRYQEQIQMIATAIGKPTANVLTNVRANSESKFGSGRVWSNDIWLAPSLQVEKGRQKK
jgi:hypothetical protein